jgi:alanyl-tRNA synthetase
LFKHLIQFIADLAQIKDLQHTSLRVVADHIRSCAFLITDGVIPSNEGRGYVLRRIIRRALRQGNKLGLTDPFFYKLVGPLVKEMGEAYPELKKAQLHIEKILRQEEEQFSVTLAQGMKLFEQVMAERKGLIIPGEMVFKLYDTYGFPADLTADMARERNSTIDYDGFETAMNKQRERSRQASKFETNYAVGTPIEIPTEFTGYEDLLTERAKIVALFREGKSVDSLHTGEKGSIILDRTPFYAESGGQVGDQGNLRTSKAEFQVLDTLKQGHAHTHVGTLNQGTLKIGDEVDAIVNVKRRAATVLNHTATHLLHWVLHQVLGEHAIQKGSLVDPQRLRFDFSHSAPLTPEEIKTIEYRVNEEIRGNHEALVRITSPKEAAAIGAVALFGEKYGDKVRVVRFGKSMELCGGTHAHHTGEVGLFKITAESGVAAGIRRIEAVTGEGALQWIENREQALKQKVTQSEERIHSLEKQLEQLNQKLSGSLCHDLVSKVKDISGIKVLATKIDGIDIKALRNTVDQLKNKLGSAVIVLAIIKDNRVSIIGGVTKNLIEKIKANELVANLALQIGGKGGGRADLAEAGGNQPEHLADALESVYLWVADRN